MNKCYLIHTIGGAAITCKNELEQINGENLEVVCSQLRQSMMPSGKVVGMDWSKRPGISDVSCNVNEFEHQLTLDSHKFIVVHGAGILNYT